RYQKPATTPATMRQPPPLHGRDGELMAPTRPEEQSMTTTSSPLGRRRLRRSATTWTAATIRDLGTTTDIITAGSILGIGRTTSYRLAKAGSFPVQLIRVGRRYIVPVEALLHLLDVD